MADKKLYKCKKVVLSNFTKKICKWKGTLDEYIRHVKHDHKTSYKNMKGDAQKFQWKLPFIGNQTDIGIIEHELGLFLYEIYYEGCSSNLYFLMTLLNSNQQTCKKRLYYQLLLRTTQTTYAFVNAINTDFNNLEIPIQEHKGKIVISKNILSEYVDKTRKLEWSLVVRVQ